jgi:RNA polymerase sigma factor (sigma-70 family)
LDVQKDWFDNLYLQCSPKMVSIAMRAGLTVEEAEEITQDAFLLFMVKSPSIQEHASSPTVYLFATLRNLLGDALRRRRQEGPCGEIPGKADE